MAPWRRRAPLSRLPRLRSQGYMPARRERHFLPDGEWGEVMVHHQMLPVARRRHNDSGRGGDNGGSVEGDRVDCCGQLKRGPREDGWPGTGVEDRGGVGDGRPRRSCRALPPATVGVVKGLEEVGSGEAGEGSEVPDGLHPGIRPPDLPERGFPGPKAQL